MNNGFVTYGAKNIHGNMYFISSEFVTHGTKSFLEICPGYSCCILMLNRSLDKLYNFLGAGDPIPAPKYSIPAPKYSTPSQQLGSFNLHRLLRL